MIANSTKILFAGKEYSIVFYESDPGSLVIQICDKALGCNVEEIKLKSGVFFEMLINALY